jgi:Arc/MetJ family transcription regulator
MSKTTIDIPDELLDALMESTHLKKKKDAVITAISEYIKQKRQKNFLRMAGKYSVTDVTGELEELEIAEEKDTYR